jgi:3-oxoacyl-[acyl-carrier protein] reductase
MIDLRGRAALVTGGSRGIGRASARLLARAGADVAVTYRSRADDAERVVAEIRALGRRALAVGADLGDPAAAARAVEEAAGVLGGLDVLVVNHGVWPAEDTPLAAMDDARWRSTMAANLDGVFYVVRAAAPRLRPGGTVVLVSSTAGQRGEAFHADYAATKGALIALTKSLAAELAPALTVNCVAPGWVDTEMAAGPLGDARRAAIEAAIPLGRVASAEDVAGPILFLASPLARHLTGEILNVNGGSVLCG